MDGLFRLAAWQLLDKILNRFNNHPSLPPGIDLGYWIMVGFSVESTVSTGLIILSQNNQKKEKLTDIGSNGFGRYWIMISGLENLDYD